MNFTNSISPAIRSTTQANDGPVRAAGNLAAAILSAAAFLLPTIWPADASAGPISRQLAALTGVDGADPRGPQLGAGVTFSFFDSVAVNANGEFTFNALLTGATVDSTNDSGVWSGTPGAIQVVARAGADGPGPNLGAGVAFGSFIDYGIPLINSTGQVAVRGTLTGTGITTANDTGVWSNAGGTLQVVAREGVPGANPGPGVGAGISFGNFQLNFPRSNSAGQIAFDSTLTGSGITTANDTGIWMGSASSLQVVAREGATGPGPGLGTGVLFGDLSNKPVLNSAGQVAFMAGLTGTGVNSANDSGVWVGGPGTLQVVARTGPTGPGPGLGPGVDFSFMDNPAINAAGQVAFSGGVTGTDIGANNQYGLWSGGPGSLAIVAREGDAAPGTATGDTFTSFGASPVLNAAGVLAVSANVTGPDLTAGNGSGIWEGTAGNLHLIARLGSPAPGTDSEDTFESFDSFGTLALNASGQVAFEADLTGPDIDSTNNVGLWMIGPDGILTLVARKGDTYDVAGDGSDLRTFAAFELSTDAASGDGRWDGLSDNGSLVFVGDFTDGSHALIVATVPEPSALLLSTCGLGLFVIWLGASRIWPAELPRGAFPAAVASHANRTRARR